MLSRRSPKRRGARHAPRLAGRLLFIVALATVLLITPLPAAYRALWLSKLLDVLHIPLFLVLTLGIQGSLSRLAMTWPARCPLPGRFSTAANRELATSVAIAVLLAAFTEAGQMLTSRTASIGDFFRDGIGISIAVLLVMIRRNGCRFSTFLIGAIAVLALLAWPVFDAGPALYGAYSSWRAFPVLWDCRHAGVVHAWHFDSPVLEHVNERGNDTLHRVLFLPGKGGASYLVLFPMVRDWSRYQRLECDLSFVGDPLVVLVSIRDGRRVLPPQRRFDEQQRLRAGPHRISIDLKELSRGGRYAAVDLTRVQSLHLGVEQITEPRRVLLQRIWLE